MLKDKTKKYIILKKNQQKKRLMATSVNLPRL